METHEIQEDIRFFFEHFTEALEYVKQLPASQSEHPNKHRLIVQKLFCCTVLDALAVARYAETVKGNERRLKRLLRDHTAYLHWDKVSILQVLYDRENRADDRWQALVGDAREDLAAKTEYAVQQDPSKTDLANRDPQLKNDLDRYTYIALFYRYRCTLVHEMREPGHGYEFGHEKEPCYKGQIEMDTEGHTFQLTYPAAFFFRLCHDAIAGLEQYFLANQRSPYTAFESRFGDVWR